MLAVSAATAGVVAKDECGGEMENFAMGCNDDFPDFAGGNLLDSIDFNDFFVGIHIDGDVLPDLEMDPEVLVEFSISPGEEYSDTTTTTTTTTTTSTNNVTTATSVPVVTEEEDNSNNNSNNKTMTTTTATTKNDNNNNKVEENLSKRDESKGKSSKSSAQSKNNNNNNSGKRKVKVDWTPELHRRFVQAVEQLGVDKAVPSRILELMGIDCLTRHNIASHLQKYRSHRKHLLAREAEAASWSQRRQIYGAPPPPPPVAGTGGGGGKREISPWVAPTMGFPPPMPHFRPLHVWGHPSVDQSLLHMWPKPHHSASPPPVWTPGAPPPPLTDPSFWHSHHQRVPTPCFPAPIAPARFPGPPVAGIVPPVAVPVPAGVYKVDTPPIAVPSAPTASAQPPPRPPFDFHPSKESIDAAIGDVLSKPWLPLPLGLKPPFMDAVMVELQRQGIPKIPPPTTCA